MKKSILYMITLLFLLALPGQALAEQTAEFRIGSNIYTCNKISKVMDATPFIDNGRTFVPIRFLGYALGISDDNIYWDDETQEITLILNGTTVKIQVGSNSLSKNGVNSQMDVSPLIKTDGRTYLPARYIAEAFGAYVGWNQSTQTVFMVCYNTPSQSDTPSGGKVLTTPGYDDQGDIADDETIPPYNWTYKSDDWTWDPLYKQKDVNGLLGVYKRMLHPHYTDYQYMYTYCVKPSQDEKDIVAYCAKCIKEGSAEEDYGEADIIGDVIAFVQSFTYVNDSDSTGYDEYPRYPLETLFERKGDCEDTSILTACLIRELGYGAALIIFDGEPGHCAVGVACDDNWPGTYYKVDGRRYYYLETTDKGWGIGQVPNDLKGRKANVIPLP